MTVWQKAAAAATALFEGPRKIGPPPAPNPVARPLPDPLRGAGRGVRPVLPAPAAASSPAPLAVASPTSPARAVERRVAAHIGTRERRGKRDDRRKGDRRRVDLGSPYGTERRSGRDDRQGDRRDATQRAAGIGLARDYFSQVDARVTSRDTGLLAGELVRFHG